MSDRPNLSLVPAPPADAIPMREADGHCMTVAGLITVLLDLPDAAVVVLARQPGASHVMQVRPIASVHAGRVDPDGDLDLTVPWMSTNTVVLFPAP